MNGNIYGRGNSNRLTTDRTPSGIYVPTGEGIEIWHSWGTGIIMGKLDPSRLYSPCQIRVFEDKVWEIASEIESGITFAPIKLFEYSSNPGKYIILDGMHRSTAHYLVGKSLFAVVKGVDDRKFRENDNITHFILDKDPRGRWNSR